MQRLAGESQLDDKASPIKFSLGTRHFVFVLFLTGELARCCILRYQVGTRRTSIHCKDDVTTTVSAATSQVECYIQAMQSCLLAVVSADSDQVNTGSE